MRRIDSRPDWQIALAATAVLRVFYSATAALFLPFLHPDLQLIRSNGDLTATLPMVHGLHYALLGIWQRFDTIWYLRIAARGYDLPGGVVFYPLYPWLIRTLTPVAGPIGAALLISTVAVLFYFWGLLHLAQADFPDHRPLRTLILTAVWPASFFFFAGYTESLAAALIIWCVNWARKEHWALAAACAFAAGLTRSAGSLLIVPLAVMAWRGRRGPRWAIAIAPMGTLAYWLWLRETGRPSTVEAYRKYWSTDVASPWRALWDTGNYLARHPDSLVIISVMALILFFVVGVMARHRIEERLFSAAVIVHILLRRCLPPLFGAPRYVLPIYPAFLTMGGWAEKMARTRFAFLCAVLFLFNLAWMWAFFKWSLVL